MLPRRASHWASFAAVAWALDGIAALVDCDRDFDHVLLLTGQDFPIKPVAELERFFEVHRGRSFIEVQRLPYDRWGPDGGVERLSLWHWHTTLAGRRVHVPSKRMPVRIHRRPPDGFELFGGSAYWSLSRAAAEYVRDFVRRRPDVVRFFRHASAPDEMFFQIVLMNSEQRESIVSDDLRYIDWSARRSSPKVLTMDDFDRLAASPALFARKFDTTVDARVLDDVERRLVRAEEA